MRRTSTWAWPATLIALVACAPWANGAGVVSGKVVMSDLCSPEVSPAVVVLEPKSGQVAAKAAMPDVEVALINQRGLQFVPRVQAIPLGSKLRFTNDDTENHNVHILSPGNDFNESMAPGQPREFTPVKAGIVRLGCDIHSHMRGYVVVSESPFVQVCSAQGKFKFRDVPDGAYTFTVWHEMGDSLKREVVVKDGQAEDLGDLVVATPKRVPLAVGEVEKPRPWADVIDRIGVMLTAALDCAAKPDGYKKARKLAEDAYFVEFETSDMETAVRGFLGVDRAGMIERRFRGLFRTFRDVSQKKSTVAEAFNQTKPLLLDLAKASDELNKKGVTDGAHLRSTAADSSPSVVDPSVNSIDTAKQLVMLRDGFDRVLTLADSNDPDEASSAMSLIYFEEFEPLERFIMVRRPQDVRPLEAQFSAIRGAVGEGLKGSDLTEKLATLHEDTALSVARSSREQVGSFASAFGISLITIVREGVEVILLLAMLFALVSKTGQIAAKRAIYWGVGLATGASGLTALALNRMVDSAQGRSRETLEGVVMLAAAGVLFYVSYWLISQSESKRWTAFLKRQASIGSSFGLKAFLTLMVTAFLAVYREGAETALMYQAMIGSQNGSREGLTGLAAGLGVGLLLLTFIAYLFRATTMKLPMRPFFQITGGFLFFMSVMFAGNAVFELQQSGILKTTPFAWAGPGLPLLGAHPNVQALSVQGLLLAGAAVSLVLAFLGDKAPSPAPLKVNVKPTAGVGV